MRNKFSISISLVILFFCLAQNFSKAQIICTQTNAVNSGNATLDIDVNNDSSPDFRITSAQVSTLGFVVVQAGQIATSNSILTSGTGSALALPFNAVISSTSTTWTQMNGTNQQMVLATNTVVTGTWAGVTNQYMGLKFIVGTNTYYGWARFSFSNASNTYTFSEYAYNSSPGQQILAGQGCGTIASPIFTLPTNICTGGSTTVSANTGTATPTNYYWLGSSGSVFSNSLGATSGITFTSSGLYTVTLLVTSGTIIGTAQNTLIVGFTPTVSNSGAACLGQSVGLSAGGGTAYLWSGPNGFTSNVQNPVIAQLGNNGGGNYTLMATSAIGCTANAITSVTLKPLPTISVSPSTSNICAPNQTVLLNANGNATSYTWSPGQGLSSTTGINVIATTSVSQIYTVTGTLNGCTNEATAAINLPTGGFPTFTISSPNNFTMCSQPLNGSPNTVTLSVGNPSNPSYSLVIINSPSLSSTIIGSTMVVLSPLPPYPTNSVLSTFTLSSTDGTCSFGVPLSLFIFPNPTVSILPLSSTICAGQSFTFNTSGANAYTLSNSVSGSNTFTTNTVVVNPLSNYNYSLIGSSDGCNSATQTATLTVNQGPIIVASNPTVCSNNKAVISATGANSYLWSGPNNFTSNASSFSVNAPSTSTVLNYTITGTATNSCTASVTTNLVVDLCTGLKESSKEFFNLFPNPGHDVIYVIGESLRNKSVKLFNALGEEIFAIKAEENKIRIDIESLSEGIYILRLRNEGGEFQAIRFFKN